MEEQKFLRPNGQHVTMPELAECAVKYMMADVSAEYVITVGTDSQSADKTKMVEVVAVRRCSKGGIFFYRAEYVTKVRTLRQKIQEETQRSLSVADEFLQELDKHLVMYGYKMDDLNVHFQIHCDVGHNGQTKVLIQEIVGWVQSLGYECCIKPDSYTASAVADKYSK